jgi:acyl carrier protein
MLREEELSRLVKAWILEHSQREVTDLDDETDLLAGGALDSMGFIELLGYVESVTGHKIDLYELDPGGFTSIRGLVRNVLIMPSA